MGLLVLSSGMGLLFSCTGGGGRQTLQDSVPASALYVRCAEGVYSFSIMHWSLLKAHCRA